MYFKSVVRINPATGQLAGYYRLVESYRNANDRVCHRTLLNIGFTDLTPDQMVEIQRRLSDRALGRPNIFESDDAVINVQVDRFWNELLANKKVDTPEQARKSNSAISIQRACNTEMSVRWEENGFAIRR